MKLIVLPLTFLGLLAVASADALHDQIKAIGEGASKAMMNKDMDAFDKVVHPVVSSSFTYSEDGGKPMSYAMMLSQMKKGVGAMASISYANSKFLNVKKQGDTEVASSMHTMLGKIMGQDKKLHSMSYKGLSTDVYKMEGGKWKIISMTMQTKSMKMDGRTIQPGKM